MNWFGGRAQDSFYSAAKAGILGLIKSAALEYVPHDIRVNALAAGAFRTPLLEAAIEGFSGSDPRAREAMEAHYDQEIAPGRIGRPEEAVEAVTWSC